MVRIPTQERGNEGKSSLISFPRSCVGMHIYVTNILLPTLWEKLKSHEALIQGS